MKSVTYKKQEVKWTALNIKFEKIILRNTAMRQLSSEAFMIKDDVKQPCLLKLLDMTRKEYLEKNQVRLLKKNERANPLILDVRISLCMFFFFF